MAINLPTDFKEFLRLLNSNAVEYLLVGGYAVAYYGYPRATSNFDVWIRFGPDNARRIVDVLKQFGFDTPGLTAELFLQKGRMVRLGLPPIRIEVMVEISGVDFDECYVDRVTAEIDGVSTDLISLKHLKINKRASGRHKDLDDIEHLP